MIFPYEKIEGEVTMEQAKAMIGFAEQCLATTGSVSNEYDRLNSIYSDLEQGIINPNQVDVLVREIMENRQDYH